MIGLVYWLETSLATSLRYRKFENKREFTAGEAAGDPDREAPDIDNPLSLVRAELASLSFFATVLAAVGVVTWFILYVL